MGSLAFDWKTAFARNTWKRETVALVYGRPFLKVVFSVTTLASLVFLVLNLFAQGFSLHDLIFDLYVTAAAYANLHFSGGLNAHVFDQLSMIFAYLNAILGGLLVPSVETKIERRLIVVLSFLPAILEQLELMYIGSLPPGKILDVGCGNGNRLERFRSLGWDAQGQEVDPQAAAEARCISGAPVHLGQLEEARFPGGSFDAITMNHVIEHVHDPVRLLQECGRILRTGGTLVVITPNAESHGRDRCGISWRGLEPPRHLHLFSRRALHQTAVKAGFLKCETWTSAARPSGSVPGNYEKEASTLGRRGTTANLKRRIMFAVYQFPMSVAHRKFHNSGEECVLRAER
jgi:SAM-dependent methyltransferase